MYSQALTADQVAALADQELPEQSTDPEEPENPETLTPDMLNVDFTTGSAEDRSEHKREAKGVGSETIISDPEMKSVATFNGEYDAYTYAMTSPDYEAMKKSMTIEVVFKMDEIPASGEYEVFSNQQSGGVGLGVENGGIIMYCHAAGGYKKPVAPITAGQWYHVLGTYDGQAVKLYVNGELVQTISAPGEIQWPGEASHYFVIGGDSQKTVAQSFLGI